MLVADELTAVVVKPDRVGRQTRVGWIGTDPVYNGVVPWEPLPDRSPPPPTAVAESLDRLMRHFRAPRLATVRSVFDDWADVVGDHVAARAHPLTLRDGVLTLAVPDPAWATQLGFLEVEILGRIASRFGPDEVTSIVVRVRPEHPRRGPS